MVIPLIVWAALIFVALIILLWFFPVALWFQAILSGVRLCDTRPNTTYNPRGFYACNFLVTFY